MANVTPNGLIVGYSYLAAGAAAPANGIFVPLSVLTGLSAAEADGPTGDGRKLTFELCRALIDSYNGMDASSRPTKMSITRSTPTGVSSNVVRQAYTFTFDLEIVNSDVAAES